MSATPADAQPVPTPVVSHHQHLMSPAAAALWRQPAPFEAADLIAQLDAAGIARAVVLSVAYTYGDERKQLQNEHQQVCAENDWTAAQVARWPQRLTGFCGVNPLRPYALEELARCSRLRHMPGLKLHLGNSGVDLRDPDHAARLAEVFRAASRQRMPIVIHLRARSGTPYGREAAVALLRDVLPAAPASIVQVAHLAGAGPGYPADADAALGVLADAVAAGDPRTRNLYFDVTTVVTPTTSGENAALIARRIRQIGPQRVLFGADLSIGGNPPPGDAWALFRRQIPLTDAEVRTIAGNVAPYLDAPARPD